MGFWARNPKMAKVAKVTNVVGRGTHLVTLLQVNRTKDIGNMSSERIQLTMTLDFRRSIAPAACTIRWILKHLLRTWKVRCERVEWAEVDDG